MKTQKSQVLGFIRQRGSITSMQAFKLFGITRLSAIIYRIEREDDIYIARTRLHGKSRLGRKVSFTEYSLY